MAWRFRRPLWKYRSLIKHRKAIAAGAGALCLGAITLGALKSPSLRHHL